VDPTSNAGVQTIGVVSVATNIYLDYWKLMVTSADNVTKKGDLVTFSVFTDNPLEAEKFGEKLKNVNVIAFQIPAYGWPEATLFRYSIFEEHSKYLQTDILVHLDADMEIVANPWERVRKNLSMGDICFIKHPGYWRPEFPKKAFFYLVTPLRAISDLVLWLRNGGIGAWEDNKRSKAFIPRSQRKNYYCGGMWFGKKQKFIDLVRDLSSNVTLDNNHSVIAKWQDESHLNYWANQNDHRIESPELCFDNTYTQLKDLIPVIIAVRKKEKTR
jgi:hypothetical protein